MKKLLGLVALAPLSLAACGGSGLDNHQTIVKDSIDAELGGDIAGCENFLDSTHVDTCETMNESMKELLDTTDIDLDFTDWVTHDEKDGKIEVDFSFSGKITQGDDSMDIEATDVTYVLEKNSDDEWKISDGKIDLGI